jgi:hypothetical protein
VWPTVNGSCYSISIPGVETRMIQKSWKQVIQFGWKHFRTENHTFVWVPSRWRWRKGGNLDVRFKQIIGTDCYISVRWIARWTKRDHAVDSVLVIGVVFSIAQASETEVLFLTVNVAWNSEFNVSHDFNSVLWSISVDYMLVLEHDRSGSSHEIVRTGRAKLCWWLIIKNVLQADSNVFPQK